MILLIELTINILLVVHFQNRMPCWLLVTYDWMLKTTCKAKENKYYNSIDTSDIFSTLEMSKNCIILLLLKHAFLFVIQWLFVSLQHFDILFCTSVVRTCRLILLLVLKIHMVIVTSLFSLCSLCKSDSLDILFCLYDFISQSYWS